MNKNLSTIPSPCFVLEEDLLRKNLELIADIQQKANCQVICALKGFAMHAAFPIVNQYVQGATASSLNEAKLADEFFHQHVHVYAPAYTEEEFPEVLKLASHLTFNSLSQWKQMKETFNLLDHKNTSFGLRINPEYGEVSTDLYNPGRKGSRLGIPVEQFSDTLPEGIEGLHFHLLCESNSDVLERTLKVVEEKFGHLLHQAKWLNMGGGHLVTSKGYNIDLLIATVKRIKEQYDIEIIIEPGSAFAWQTGFLKTKVIDKLSNSGEEILMIDASFSAHMPDCLEMPYKPTVRGAVEKGTHQYTLGGLTCLAGDYIEDFQFDHPKQEGDEIIFEDMIHYTMVKTTEFNGVKMPSIGILRSSGEFELVKSFGYNSYRDRLS